MNHVTIGVYPSNDFKVNIVKEEDLVEHIAYNDLWRPGRMLFVDGKYAVGGLLKEEYKTPKIAEWEEKISKMKIDTRVPSRVYV